MKFCTNCGFKLDDDARFCPECGTQVPASDPAPAAAPAPQQPVYEEPAVPAPQPTPVAAPAPQQPVYEAPAPQAPQQPTTYEAPSAPQQQVPQQQAYYAPPAPPTAQSVEPMYQQPAAAPQYAQQPVQQQVKTQKKKTGLIIGLIAGGVVIAAVVVFLFLFVFKGSSKPEPGYYSISMIETPLGNFEGSMLEDYGYGGMYLKLNEDGTGEMCLPMENNDPTPLTWDDKTITCDGDSLAYTFENGRLILKDEVSGLAMYFARTSQPPVAPQVDPIPEPEPVDLSERYGFYELSGVSMEGEEVSGQDLEDYLLESGYGYEQFYIELLEDGEGYVYIPDSDVTAIYWDETIITDEIDVIEYQFEPGMITLILDEETEMYMWFEASERREAFETWTDSIEVPSYWYGTMMAFGESEEEWFDVWAMVDTVGDRPFFEIYDTEACDNTPILSMWILEDSYTILPDIGEEDAWLLDYYLTEADANDFTIELDEGALAFEVDYELDGEWYEFCFFLREESAPWDVANDPLPPSYYDYYN